MDKVLSDDGDHSETGIVLLVGGLQMRERWYIQWVGREKNRDYFAYKYIQSKESYYLLNEILNKYNQNDPKWHSPINLGKLGNEFHRPFKGIG